MSKLDVNKLNEQIKKANEAFEKLSLLEQRVTIAKDVLHQLRLNKIIAESGTYLSAPELVDTNEDAQLQDVFKTVEQCSACALGSLFFCAVGIANAITVGETSISQDGELMGGDAYDYLEKYFEREQLSLIESAFEQADMRNSYQDEDEDEEINEAIEFGLQHFDDASRLQAIMENIVANKGTFLP